MGSNGGAPNPSWGRTPSLVNRGGTFTHPPRGGKCFDANWSFVSCWLILTCFFLSFLFFFVVNLGPYSAGYAVAGAAAPPKRSKRKKNATGNSLVTFVSLSLWKRKTIEILVALIGVISIRFISWRLVVCRQLRSGIADNTMPPTGVGHAADGAAAVPERAQRRREAALLLHLPRPLSALPPARRRKRRSVSARKLTNLYHEVKMST